MPLVILSVGNVGSVKGGLESISCLPGALREIVAKALDTPEEEDGRLTAGDIEVWGRDHHPLDSNTFLIEVVVFAGNYPARAANIMDRAEQIERELRGLFPWIAGNGFVWVLPQSDQAFRMF